MKDIILKCTCMYSSKEINEIRKEIFNQLNSGVVILPPGIEFVNDTELIARAIDELETEKKNYIKDVGKCGYTEGIGYAIQTLKYLNKEEGKNK